MNAREVQRLKNVWIALSELYVDTELSEDRISRITETLKSSGYSIFEVIQINKTQVFPILYSNLLSTAGIWSGIEEKWLINSIIDYLNSTSWIRKTWYAIIYLFLSKSLNKEWDRICDHWENSQ